MDANDNVTTGGLGDADGVRAIVDESDDTSKEETNGFSGRPRRSSLLSRSGRPRVKKSVSFCSMPEDRRVSNAADCLNFMRGGCELTKIKASGRLYKRYYWVDDDLTELRWMPTSKKYSKAKIAIDQIKEVQAGKNSEILRCKDAECAVYQEEYMFTILYGANYKPLDLIAKSPDEVNIWIAGLTRLIMHRGQSKDNPEHENRVTIRDRWLTESFVEVAGTVEDILSEAEIIALILRLNPAVDTQYINQRLKELYSSERNYSKGSLTCEEFINLYKSVASRQEIYFLMTKYGRNDGFMDAEDLMLFLETEQCMPSVSQSFCEEIIHKFEPSREGKAKCLLGIDGLLAYLLSEDCDVFDSKYKVVHQDMTQPLSQYYINSSHKTYLSEDQLKGPSTVSACIRALKLGCRFIEVDCWDGPDGPVVYHGRTLTSKISFADVIDAINKHAFQTTCYPLILSLENHCTLEQQQVIVQCLTSVLQGKLYTKSVHSAMTDLPSPEQLKYKILIKCKKLEEAEENGDVSEEDESVDPDWRRLSRKGSPRKIPLLKELSDLVTWCQSCSYEKYQYQKELQRPNHLYSVSDLYAQKLMMNAAEELAARSKQFLHRIYPNCSRVDSSNYNPQDFWNFGFQIAALNQQTQGFCTDLNLARFKQNGNCGYVLKPALLRDKLVTFNPLSSAQGSLPGITPQAVHIKVISGHRFPKPKGSCTKSLITDPYVLIEVFGIPADCASSRTKTVPGNGQNPFFDESFTFYLQFPELAMIRFNILDDDFIGDEFIAQYTMPYICINRGFRHINLLSNTGERLPGCTLFVHISSQDVFDKKQLKRGLTASRVKGTKDPVNIKCVGMKLIDETLKCLLSHLTDIAELRLNVEQAQAKFKDACDVDAVTNIKYCVRSIVNRVSCSKGMTIKLVNTKLCPLFLVDGNSPDILKKALLAYSIWCKECYALIDEGEPIRTSMQEIEHVLLGFQAEMRSYVSEAGLSEKKAQKVVENLAWNLQLLKDQLRLLDQYIDNCKTAFVKVVEAAVSNGIEVVSDSTTLTSSSQPLQQSVASIVQSALPPPASTT